MARTDYDAIVIGSGPNGLAAAVTMQQKGLRVLLVEGKETIGGGLRTAEITLPGYRHDICSAIHPLAVSSPFFRQLPLEKYGLKFVQPPVCAAHPFDDGTVAALFRSVDETADRLGVDRQAYHSALSWLAKEWPEISADVLGPLTFPRNPFALARFGIQALRPASGFSKRFRSEQARGLWAGMAAHSMLPLSDLTTSAIGLVLMAAGHNYGWPIPVGGSQSIANALAAYFTESGGTIRTGCMIKNLDQLPSSKVILFDCTPKQLLDIAGDRFTSFYRRQLSRFRYGMGVFKVDWALSGPVPFRSEECRQAGTVHLGGTIKEIMHSESEIAAGRHPEKPFVLLAQQSVFDPYRVPHGKQAVWAYCHVPNGSEKDMTSVIEHQVERFAPGFRDLILARNTMNTTEMNQYNPNYIGGDINGGRLDIGQLYSRPALRISPYRTSAKGIYICSSSTPPGGGVHGMCGYHAAQVALKDFFNLN